MASLIFTSDESSIRHSSDNFFHFRNVHHHDGIPWAAVQEASVRSLAHALLAPDAENGVHVDASERRIILIRPPEHTVLHPRILDAVRQSRAARETPPDDHHA